MLMAVEMCRCVRGQRHGGSIIALPGGSTRLRALRYGASTVAFGEGGKDPPYI